MSPELIAKKGTEHSQQVALLCWMNQNKHTLPFQDLIFAIPNGANKTMATAAKFKAEGLKRGVPDLCLPVPRGRYHGLYLEMKKPSERKNKNAVKEEQWDWLNALSFQGYMCGVAYSFEEARDFIIKYYANGEVENV